MIDACYRLAYRSAYKAMRVYWKLAKPLNHGALVAIWHAGRILLVKNSYVDYYSLPGGYVRKHESAKEAAARGAEPDGRLFLHFGLLMPCRRRPRRECRTGGRSG